MPIIYISRDNKGKLKERKYTNNNNNNLGEVITTRKLVISDGIFGLITFCPKSFLHFEQNWDGFKIQIFSSQIRP